MDSNNIGAKQKYGSFASMKLPSELFKGVMAMKYTAPTPIQRVMIPQMDNGFDVIASSRTGSGKTAAFMIPIIKKIINLKAEKKISEKILAVIISPTKDLAIQTFQFSKKLVKFCEDIKLSLIVGGESIEEQFEKLHANPDILFATPGRLVHLLAEMGVDEEVRSKMLSCVCCLVFDEADRLFELGFKEQMTQLLKYVNNNSVNFFGINRQIALVTATIPNELILFSNAGLKRPKLVQVEKDLKLSPNLVCNFIHCRSKEEKWTVILYFLHNNIIKETEKTLIFLPTKYHVEFLYGVLGENEIVDVSKAYSSMDEEARRINLQKFKTGKNSLMLVTDISARGLDLPYLDNVINFNSAISSNLFIHRVGRVARCNRPGTSYSLICSNEMPHIVGLFCSLNMPLKYFNGGDEKKSHFVIGSVPGSVYADQLEYLKLALNGNKYDCAYQASCIDKADKKAEKFTDKASVNISANDICNSKDYVNMGFNSVFRVKSVDLVGKQINKVCGGTMKRNVSAMTPEQRKIYENGLKMMQKHTKKRTIEGRKEIVVGKRYMYKETEKDSTKNSLKPVIKFNVMVEGGENKSTFDDSVKLSQHLQNYSLQIKQDQLTTDVENKSGKKNKKTWDKKKKKFITVNYSADGSCNGAKNEFNENMKKAEKSMRYKKWLNMKKGGGANLIKGELKTVKEIAKNRIRKDRNKQRHKKVPRRK